MKRNDTSTKGNLMVPKNFEIKPFYTVAELAPVLNYKSNKGCRQFLLKLSLPLHLVGKRYIVYLSDIQNHQPELYDSILEANNLKMLIKKQEELPISQDNESPGQFYSS